MRNRNGILVRLCVVCRQRQRKEGLIRVVKQKNGKIFVDKIGKAEGRGAYICNRAECLQILKKRRSLERSFKSKIDGEVYCEIEKEFGKDLV